MDPSLYEAAIDLGATPRQALWKVIIPEVIPGVLSGFLLAITLSLDDFIILMNLSKEAIAEFSETDLPSIKP